MTVEAPKYIPTKKNHRTRLVLTGLIAVAFAGYMAIRGVSDDNEHTPLPDATADTNPNLDLNGSQAAIDIAAQSTSTLVSTEVSTEEILATIAPTEGKDTPTATENVVSIPVEGEVPLNNLREEEAGIEVWQNILQDIVWKESTAPIDTTNAFETSLRNPVDYVNLFGPVVVTEPGLGHSLDSIKAYQPAFMGFERLERYTGKDLLRDQGDMWAGGFYAEANNRDYAIFKAAWAILSVQDARFAEMSELDALTDQEAIARMIPIKERILSLTQKKSLIFSPAELERRELPASDPSNLLDDDLQEPGQWISCDVFLPEDEAATREDQTEQDTRTVIHKQWDRQTHSSADSENEWLLYAVSINKNDPNEWTVKAFTDRGHTFADSSADWQLFSASGEQLLPCGEDILIPEEDTPTPTTTPQASPSATQSASPTVVYPTTTPGVTSTESEEDTPTVVITNTPGGTPTDRATQPALTSTTSASTPTVVPPTTVPPTRTNEPLPTDRATQPAPPTEEDGQDDPTEEPTEENGDYTTTDSDVVNIETDNFDNDQPITVIVDSEGNEYEVVPSNLTRKVNLKMVV